MQFSLAGQTSHAVGVTSNVFSPNELTINVGDTVIWTNTQGTHNVNGTKTTFANNPESFGNEVGAGWVYTHVFTTAGAYDYRCDPHFSFGMTGKITVTESGPTGVVLNAQRSSLSLYPNPATDFLSVASDRIMEAISIYNVTGARVVEYVNLRASEYQISLDGINAGIYFIEVRSADYNTQISRLVKR